MMYMHHGSDLASDGPCACTALRKAVRTLDRIYDASLAPLGLTTTQFAILRHIERAGEIVLSQLAGRMVMDRTSLYRTLGPIEQAGWLRITPAPRGRARLASLTEGGRDMVRRALPAWAATQDAMQARLGVEPWRELIAMSERLVALGASGGGVHDERD